MTEDLLHFSPLNVLQDLDACIQSKKYLETAIRANYTSPYKMGAIDCDRGCLAPRAHSYLYDKQNSAQEVLLRRAFYKCSYFVWDEKNNVHVLFRRVTVARNGEFVLIDVCGISVRWRER